MKSYNVILASASPRRLALLRQIPRLTVAVFPSRCDESFAASLSASEAAMVLAERKAVSAAGQLCHSAALAENTPSLRLWDGMPLPDGFLREAVFAGADTMVVAPNGQILGKPANAAAAEQMFRLLCGHTHDVITGFCLLRGAKKIKKHVKTRVTFGAFNDKIVYNYINTAAPYDKAGGYGIQDETLGPLITGIEGDLNNVIGLPLDAFIKTLKEFV